MTKDVKLTTGTDELDVVGCGSADGAPRAMLRKRRPEEWTAQDQADFLAQLAATANVTRSAQAIGKSADSAYYRRKKSVAFRRLWAIALAEGYARLEAELLDRALNGRRTVKATPGGGDIVTVEVSNQLGIQLLTLHRKTVAEHQAMVGPLREKPAVIRARLAKTINALVAKMEDRLPEPVLIDPSVVIDPPALPAPAAEDAA